MIRAPSIDEFLSQLEYEPGAREQKVAPLVRSYLEEQRRYLAELHRSTRSGRVVNQANSDLIDRLIRRLFALAEEHLVVDGGELERGLSVVAVGGYARREMSIHSDVDILVLYSEELTPYVTSIAERLQYWLWDAGLTVGCATRTLTDTVALGREDVTVRTAVLMARFLCGDGEYFHEFADAIRKQLLPDLGAFIAEQIENLRERHTSLGESLFLLQPNVKEGAGGLRDYHTAYWVARGTQPSIRDLDDLLHFGLLTEGEMATYRDALEFLWYARNELHLSSKRCNDQLSFELQEQVADMMGYGTAEDAGDELPVERFMRDYYRHARAIHNYSELVIEQCAARSRPGLPSAELQDLEHGFSLRDGKLWIPHATFLTQEPIRLLQAFEVAQSHGVALSRVARRLIRENLDCIDDAVRGDPLCSEVLIRILASEQRVMRSLMAMNEVGLLAAFIPEWDHIVCRWQHVLYHTYTVDVHSIFLVEELRRLWTGKYERFAPDLTELMQGVEDRPVLFLASLFHDIGKGRGGDHSKVGLELARTSVERLKLSPERVERVCFLVEHHLLMSRLAQSRDLSDPNVLLSLAQTCGDRENLHNLYLLTFADIRASSQEAWNEWRGQLLRELFERASEVLETGADDPSKAMSLIEARVERRQGRAGDYLRDLGVVEENIQAYFDSLPRRYFISHTPPQIVRHAQLVLSFEEGQLLATSYREMREDFIEFLLCAKDVHGLYAMVAGSLSACGMNILGSHVYTSKGGLALEVYRLAMPPGGPEERKLALSEFEETLSQVLSGVIEVEELIRRRRSRRRTVPPVPEPASVKVSSSESDFYTVVDVSAHDHIGLLFDVARTIGARGFEIYIAKVSTIRDQVMDTFYLKDERGKKIRDEDRLAELRDALLTAIQAGETT